MSTKHTETNCYNILHFTITGAVAVASPSRAEEEEPHAATPYHTILTRMKLLYYDSFVVHQISFRRLFIHSFPWIFLRATRCFKAMRSARSVSDRNRV